MSLIAFVRRFSRSLAFVCVACASCSVLTAQSLSLDNPAPLHAGTNSATIDSMGGNQFWMMTVGPGSFKVTFHYGERQEGFNTGGKPTMFANFKPAVPGTTLTHADFPGGSTWSGTSPKAARFVIAVVPAPGALVRQTTPYTIEATGAVSFGTVAGAAPSVAGIYQYNNDIIAKFLPDGTITSTSGNTGHWELFDAESKTYVVTFDGRRFSLTYQPGRGFVNGNGQLEFIQKR